MPILSTESFRLEQIVADLDPPAEAFGTRSVEICGVEQVFGPDWKAAR